MGSAMTDPTWPDTVSRQALIQFEDELAEEFRAGRIKAPLHLAGGNEDALIYFFKQVKPEDWVLGTWRAHYHCLLKGVPRDVLKAAILDGRSIALCFPEYRVLCSAIVGGIAPLAVGLAWGLKHRSSLARVHCFLGDMAESCGIVKEAQAYAAGFQLPVSWYVEDNAIGGTQVDTQDTWKDRSIANVEEMNGARYHRYHYHMTRPFVGVGTHIPL